MHSFQAAESIAPSRFVKQNTSADHRVDVCDAINDKVFGISHESTRTAPIPSASTDAADAGENLLVYEDGDECLLELGGTVTRGGEIRSDATGKGIAIETTGSEQQRVGARALESGVSGDKIRVQVTIDTHAPTLT